MPTTLTDSNVKALRPRACAYFTWDSQAVGLALRVTPPGRKIWVVQLYQSSRRTLGHWPAMPVEEARKVARHWRDLTKAGTDPKALEAQQRETAERARREAETVAANTFAKVAELYIAGRDNRRAVKDAKAIRRHLVKAWGDRAVASITPRDVRELMGAILKRTPHGAREAWGHAVPLFKWAVHEELIPGSPCASLDKKLVLNGARYEPRDRVLSDDELVALWRAAVARKYPEGVAVQWLMLSACRLSEGLGARWREFHPELRRALRDNGTGARTVALTDAQRVWTVPGERTGNKSGKPRDVPITDAMLALLATVPVRGPDELVFSHDGEHQLGSQSKLKFWLDKHMAVTLRDVAAKRGETYDALPPFVLHDLRHTLRTALAGLGVDDVVAEMVIGHGKKGIQRVYDHSKRLPEIRAALDKWAKHMMAIVAKAPERAIAGAGNMKVPR